MAPRKSKKKSASRNKSAKKPAVNKKTAARKKSATQRTSLASKSATRKKAKSSGGVPRCGLCGATENLTKTECCGNWICDDEHTYRLFSYARNSCSRNHSRYTVCAFHWNEGHEGPWEDCPKCRDEMAELEMYVYYATNEYNFKVLQNPPEYKPTTCSKCGAVIVLGDGGYSYSGKNGYRCGECTSW
jgi:hypothetical protein